MLNVPHQPFFFLWACLSRMVNSCSAPSIYLFIQYFIFAVVVDGFFVLFFVVRFVLFCFAFILLKLLDR